MRLNASPITVGDSIKLRFDVVDRRSLQWQTCEVEVSRKDSQSAVAATSKAFSFSSVPSGLSLECGSCAFVFYSEKEAAELSQTPETMTKVVESPHPYDHNMNKDWVVALEGAESYEVTFDPQSTIPESADWVAFYDEKKTKSYGQSRYFDGVGLGFPGVRGEPALHIPAPRFIVHFHSDGSVNGWGFKLTATAKCAKKHEPKFKPGDLLEATEAPGGLLKIERGLQRWVRRYGDDGCEWRLVAEASSVTMGARLTPWDPAHAKSLRRLEVLAKGTGVARPTEAAAQRARPRRAARRGHHRRERGAHAGRDAGLPAAAPAAHVCAHILAPERRAVLRAQALRAERVGATPAERAAAQAEQVLHARRLGELPRVRLAARRARAHARVPRAGRRRRGRRPVGAVAARRRRQLRPRGRRRARRAGPRPRVRARRPRRLAAPTILKIERVDRRPNGVETVPVDVYRLSAAPEAARATRDRRRRRRRAEDARRVRDRGQRARGRGLCDARDGVGHPEGLRGSVARGLGEAPRRAVLARDEPRRLRWRAGGRAAGAARRQGERGRRRAQARGDGRPRRGAQADVGARGRAQSERRALVQLRGQRDGLRGQRDGQPRPRGHRGLRPRDAPELAPQRPRRLPLRLGDGPRPRRRRVAQGRVLPARAAGRDPMRWRGSLIVGVRRDAPKAFLLTGEGARWVPKPRPDDDPDRAAPRLALVRSGRAPSSSARRDAAERRSPPSTRPSSGCGRGTPTSRSREGSARPSTSRRSRATRASSSSAPRRARPRARSRSRPCGAACVLAARPPPARGEADDDAAQRRVLVPRRRRLRLRGRARDRARGLRPARLGARDSLLGQRRRPRGRRASAERPTSPGAERACARTGSSSTTGGPSARPARRARAAGLSTSRRTSSRGVTRTCARSACSAGDRACGAAARTPPVGGGVRSAAGQAGVASARRCSRPTGRAGGASGRALYARRAHSFASATRIAARVRARARTRAKVLRELRDRALAADDAALGKALLGEYATGARRRRPRERRPARVRGGGARARRRAAARARARVHAGALARDPRGDNRSVRGSRDGPPARARQGAARARERGLGRGGEEPQHAQARRARRSARTSTCTRRSRCSAAASTPTSAPDPRRVRRRDRARRRRRRRGGIHHVGPRADARARAARAARRRDVAEATLPGAALVRDARAQGRRAFSPTPRRRGCGQRRLPPARRGVVGARGSTGRSGSRCRRWGQPCAAIDELMQLIGLQTVKKSVLALYAQIQAERRYEESQRMPLGFNFCLLGNPGTGKTTVARILGRVLHELGVRASDTFTQTSAEELVRKGADEAAQAIEEAMGGVFFVDEAYMLEPDSSKEGARSSRSCSPSRRTAAPRSRSSSPGTRTTSRTSCTPRTRASSRASSAARSCSRTTTRRSCAASCSAWCTSTAGGSRTSASRTSSRGALRARAARRASRTRARCGSRSRSRTRPRCSARRARRRTRRSTSSASGPTPRRFPRCRRRSTSSRARRGCGRSRPPCGASSGSRRRTTTASSRGAR